MKMNTASRPLTSPSPETPDQLTIALIPVGVGAFFLHARVPIFYLTKLQALVKLCFNQ
jgi:hypothetical protein